MTEFTKGWLWENSNRAITVERCGEQWRAYAFRRDLHHMTGVAYANNPGQAAEVAARELQAREPEGRELSGRGH